MHKFLVYCLGILALVMSLSSVIAQEQNTNEEQDENGGFMEATFGFAAFDSRFVDAPQHLGVLLNLRLNYQWNGFFIENKGVNGLGLPGFGYNFYRGKEWSFDVYFSEIYGAIASDDAYDIGNEQDGLVGILPREEEQRAGLRSTYNFDDSSVLRVLVAPFSALEHRDIHLAMWYGKSWQRYNTNFHTILSAQYDSKRTLNHFYGVSGSEISDKFRAYQAGGGLTLSAELGLTYPLAKDWVIESSLKVIRLPNSIYDSPLVENRIETIAQISLVYVLF
ncbi:MipA/OmpV family protein [Paraglaciecola hydrolytica]|uniref:Structural protein MipA n=1 Tax=Paraglaciecola hydrolytica TaxID=1799789 RepID=A0A148KMG7_9ALTE|nr:MipA/OmpV family protein [Paraglaciecola hydrolytica]KXI27438.1 hypothetical protein AX660_22245 [Paraglaciecola hydrolytica]